MNFKQCCFRSSLGSWETIHQRHCQDISQPAVDQAWAWWRC